MPVQKYIVFAGCIALVSMVLACSLADEPHSGTQGAEAAQTTQGQEPSGKADHAEDTTPDAPTCTGNDDCRGLDHTVHWCSPEGLCRYGCEPGYGDANGEENADGCECELSNAGREVCDGVDDDCDGVVDNPFVGGRVAAGKHHTCAVDAAGAVNCWGEQTLKTAQRRGVEAFWEVSAGSRHSCALTKEGQAFCWGDNDYGQVGPDARRHAQQPVRLSEELRFIDITTGAEHSCGLTYDSAVYCWGANDYGQLGDGTLDEQAQPVLVGSNTQDFVDVTAGDFHTCAAKATGEVLCWGANILGQVGQEELDDVVAPTAVDVPEALIFVEAGANHTCGITGQGLVYCWGNNSYGQLGDDTRLSTYEPRQVVADAEFVALSAGSTHTCAIAQNGRLFCWGSNVDGRLGTDTPGQASFRPRAVTSDLSFSDIAAGAAHTCALSRDGHMYCWGDASHGQLERERAESRRLPARSDCP